MKKTLGEFEQYLQEIHAKDYHGLDDDMPDSFNAWVSELDAGEMKEYEKEWSDEIDKGFALEAELLRLLIATRAEPGLELERVGGLIREAFDDAEIKVLIKKLICVIN